jgi:hypothetical protein
MSSKEYSIPHRPRLIADIRKGEGNTIFTNTNHEIIAADLSQEVLTRILGRFNGITSIDEILEEEPSFSRENAAELIEALDSAGLIDDASAVSYKTGAEVILEIEELIEDYCAPMIFENKFWRLCMSAREPKDLPEKLAIGMVIENWHFLFRESYFDAPVLSYVPNTSVRLLMNQFFSEEYGHDEILLRSLNSVGITREDMSDVVPLPETMGLCNALAYWAHNDPLFFFTTLGLLEGQGEKHDSFIDACERCGFSEEFVGPLRTHSNINIGAAHGNLTRQIFQEIRALDANTVARLKRQVRLFVELYNAFYTGVWRYYMSNGPLLRLLSEF